MNAEESKNCSGRDRDDLLRLACGERGVAPASPHLRELLDDDDELRAEFDQAHELLRRLRNALRPEPLPETLARRIHARLAEQAAERPPSVSHPFRLVGLAAAAAMLALAALGPLGMPPAAREAPALLTTLSADDAADIVAAYSLLNWNGPLGYSLERLSAELDDIDQRIERGRGARSPALQPTGRRTGLPWEPVDDWDTPRDDRKTGLLRGRLAQNRVTIGELL